jgi:exosortase D (VPLPA-CTERM-specific)
MNSFRIGVIGVLVNRFGIAQAEGFLHFFEGWVIFLTCILLLYLEAIALQRLLTRPQPILNVLDLQMSGFAERLMRLGSTSVPRREWLAVIIMIICGAAWQFMPSSAAQVVQRSTFALFPMELGEWRGSTSLLDPTIQRVLGADDYILADFVVDGEAAINLFVAYYNSQTQGTGIHSPDVCIPGGGWEVSRWTQTHIEVGNDQTQRIAVNRAVIQKGHDRQLVYYWFEQRGRRLTSDYAAKFYTVWDSVVRGRSDGALVRVVTPVGSGENERIADQRLRRFIKPVVARLPTFVPK